MRGVHMIRNTVTGGRYIGCAQHIEQRWEHHKSRLNAGRTKTTSYKMLGHGMALPLLISLYWRKCSHLEARSEQKISTCSGYNLNRTLPQHQAWANTKPRLPSGGYPLRLSSSHHGLNIAPCSAALAAASVADRAARASRAGFYRGDRAMGQQRSCLATGRRARLGGRRGSTDAKPGRLSAHQRAVAPARCYAEGSGSRPCPR